MLTVQQRVPQGVSVLDENLPNWRDLITRSTLILSNYSGCVLGQLYGDFGIGADTLNLDAQEAKDCGFDSYASYATVETSLECEAEWAELQAEWEKVLDVA
jgi:hypothetical protein